MLRLFGLSFCSCDLEDEAEVELTQEQQDAADRFNEKACLYGGLGAALIVVIVVGVRSLLGIA